MQTLKFSISNRAVFVLVNREVLTQEHQTYDNTGVRQSRGDSCTSVQLEVGERRKRSASPNQGSPRFRCNPCTLPCISLRISPCDSR